LERKEKLRSRLKEMARRSETGGAFEEEIGEVGEDVMEKFLAATWSGKR
jgi:hypothetical protein